MTDPGARGRRQRAHTRRNAGFTLLELMIVVAVIAILAAIVLPSYQSAVYKGRRADGTTALMDLANRMQRHYSENNTFTGAAIGGTGFPATATSPQGYYTLSISVPTANTYTLTATRAGAQTADTRCGDLTLTSASVRGIVNHATGITWDKCW